MNKNNINYNTHTNDNGELFDIKRISYVVLRYWYYVVLFGFTGFALAYLYNLYRDKSYAVESKIIVPKNVNEVDFQGIFGIQPGFNASSSVNNEVEILKSYKLNNRVAEQLNWRVFWYKMGDFTWEGLYDNVPFTLLENGINQNTEDIEIYITPISQTTYNIKIKGNGILLNHTIPEDISKNLKYGVLFKNDYFNFTLLLKPDENVEPGDEYYFIFRKNSRVATNYMSTLTVKGMEEGSEVIQLKLITLDKRRGVDYLNKLVEVYMNLKIEEKTESHKKTLEFINSQLSGISDSLYVSENNFASFRSKNQLINLSQQGSNVLQLLTDTEKEKTMHQMQFEYLKNLLHYIGNEADISKIISPSVVGINDESFVSLVQKLIDLFREREIMAYTSRENNPQLILLNQEIKQVSKLLRENLTNLIENSENNISILTQRINQTSTKLKGLPEKEQKLINIQREYDMTNDIYTFLLQKKAETELTLASATIDVKVVDEATLSRTVLTGKPAISIYMLGLIIGIMIPIIFTIVIDILDKRIKTKIEIQKFSTIPILGSIVHSKKNNYMHVYNEPATLIAESFRTIRTNIKFFLDNKDEKVIGINSALSGEGKTFTSINLATVLAMNDKKTLLIGCDLRKPKLSKIFNLKSNAGLSNLLINECNQSDAIFKCKVENLYVMPAGPIPPNPLEVLEKPQFKEFIDWARVNFDYIVLDNAPSYLVSDGIISSKQCDMNIFVVRAGLTNIDMIENINNIVAGSEIKKPCFVINDLTLINYGYSYKLNYKYDYNTYSYLKKSEKTV